MTVDLVPCGGFVSVYRPDFSFFFFFFFISRLLLCLLSLMD